MLVVFPIIGSERLAVKGGSVEYTATQRCPVCQSARTTVKAVPSEAKRNGEALDVNSVWTCLDCEKVFGPSQVTVSEPILMCPACRTPTRHEHIGTVDARWTTPAGTLVPKVEAGSQVSPPVKLENYRCGCGSERTCGIAKN
jgi:hypothetical protein